MAFRYKLFKRFQVSLLRSEAEPQPVNQGNTAGFYGPDHASDAQSLRFLGTLPHSVVPGEVLDPPLEVAAVDAYGQVLFFFLITLEPRVE